MSNPFRGFFDSVSENNRAMENWMTGPHPAVIQHERGRADAWTPEMDVISEGSDLIMLVELPGVRTEEIELSLSGGILTISGDKKGRETSGDYYSRERRFGSFRRSVTLPQNVRKDGIDTSFSNGVLEISIQDYDSFSEPERIQVAE